MPVIALEDLQLLTSADLFGCGDLAGCHVSHLPLQSLGYLSISLSLSLSIYISLSLSLKIFKIVYNCH